MTIPHMMTFDTGTNQGVQQFQGSQTLLKATYLQGGVSSKIQGQAFLCSVSFEGKFPRCGHLTSDLESLDCKKKEVEWILI